MTPTAELGIDQTIIVSNPGNVTDTAQTLMINKYPI